MRPLVVEPRRPVAKAKPWEAPGVLVVGPVDPDYIALIRILSMANWNLYWYTRCREALGNLAAKPVSLAITDRALKDGDWKDVLANLRFLNAPPKLIVADHEPNRWLRAEVLKRGGFDVLAKPFDPERVMHAAAAARRDWEHTRAAPHLRAVSA